MRDPKRISEIVDLLQEYWQLQPDLRLGQLVGNMAALDFGGDPYYIEDDDMARRLTRAIHEHRNRMFPWVDIAMYDLVPQLGSVIWVYPDTETHGGWGVVDRVTKHPTGLSINGQWWVSVKELPSNIYVWDRLRARQDELRVIYPKRCRTDRL